MSVHSCAANSNCYGQRDSDTCAKSYSYTKGAPESEAATIVPGTGNGS
jgi:hypothetical protein